MDAKISLPHSQGPASCPHSESDQSCLWRHIVILWHFMWSIQLIYPSQTCSISPSPPLPHLLHVRPFSLLDYITRIILVEEVSQSSSSCSLFHSSATYSHLRPSIFLSTLFTRTLSLYSSLDERDQVPYQYKTKNEIIVLDILIFMF